MLRPAKLATPAAAVTVVVPFSVPPPGLLPIVSVTLPVNPVARLPKESYAVTSTAGVMVAPARVVPDHNGDQPSERGVQVPARIPPPQLHVRIADDATRDLVMRTRLEVEVGRRPDQHVEGDALHPREPRRQCDQRVAGVGPG